jgi:hypothetical protein
MAWIVEHARAITSPPYQNVSAGYSSLAAEMNEGLDNFSPDDNSQTELSKLEQSLIQTTAVCGILLICRKHSCWLLTIILAISILILLIANVSLPSRKKLTVLASPCGNSVDEALATECHFDIMSFCWLPSPCYDGELSNEFQSLREWSWYLDANGTKPVTREAALNGTYQNLYVSNEYHLLHCTYMWRKLHRAVLGAGKAAIDSYIGNYAHTAHCETMIANQGHMGGPQMLNTIIRVKFPDCGVV